MRRWTFRKEAGWMLWIYAILPAIAVIMGLLIPWLHRQN